MPSLKLLIILAFIVFATTPALCSESQKPLEIIHRVAWVNEDEIFLNVMVSGDKFWISSIKKYVISKKKIVSLYNGDYSQNRFYFLDPTNTTTSYYDYDTDEIVINRGRQSLLKEKLSVISKPFGLDKPFNEIFASEYSKDVLLIDAFYLSTDTEDHQFTFLYNFTNNKYSFPDFGEGPLYYKVCDYSDNIFFSTRYEDDSDRTTLKEYSPQEDVVKDLLKLPDTKMNSCCYRKKDNMLFFLASSYDNGQQSNTGLYSYDLTNGILALREQKVDNFAVSKNLICLIKKANDRNYDIIIYDKSWKKLFVHQVQYPYSLLAISPSENQIAAIEPYVANKTIIEKIKIINILQK